MMPTFIFNKLVRDKLRQEYEKLGQTAKYRTLSPSEYKQALRDKVIEEVKELRDSADGDVASEIADMYQVLDDLTAAHGISTDEIENIKHQKREKRGGFRRATFVETLELKDDDEWVTYYRKSPDVFKEIK